MKNYLLRSDEIKHNEYLALISVMARHGITKLKEIGRLIGIKADTFSHRCEGKRLNMTISELCELADKVELTDDEIAMIVRGGIR